MARTHADTNLRPEVDGNIGKWMAEGSKLQRYGMGFYCLKDGVEEAVCKLVANDTDLKDIPDLIDNKLTLEQVEALMLKPLVRKRVDYIKNLMSKK